MINYLFPGFLPRWIYKRLSFDGKFKFSLLDENVYLLNTRHEICTDIFYSGIFGNYEGYSLEIWYELNKLNTGTVLDIGAFNGIYSLVAAVANKDSEIYSFEPHPRNYDLLKDTINLNRFQNIYINDYGLSTETKSVTFFNEIGNNPSGFSSVNHRYIDKESTTLDCKVKNIREVLEKDFSQKPISLIKLDIERAELDLLTKSIDLFSEKKTSILCEILDIDDYEKFDNLFSNFEFDKYVIDDNKKRLKKVKNLKDLKEQLGRNVIFIHPSAKLPEKIKEAAL